jgi:ABC-type phosphate transport system permease subunit
MILYVFLIFLFLTWIGSTAPCLAHALECGFETFEATFNPKVKYEEGNLNWFGTIVVTVVVTIILMPMAIVFCIYKLFTVGRR